MRVTGKMIFLVDMGYFHEGAGRFTKANLKKANTMEKESKPWQTEIYMRETGKMVLSVDMGYFHIRTGRFTKANLKKANHMVEER